MEKIYPLLNWLEIGQAVDWLQYLTESPVSQYDLLTLCDSGHCEAYVDLRRPIKGGDETFINDVTGYGIQKIRNPLALDDCGTHKESCLEFTGDASFKEEDGKIVRKELDWYVISMSMWEISPTFKPADIQALAQKMNAAANQSTAAEVEELREQLITATKAKENAWHLTDKYKTELELLREKVEQLEDLMKQLPDQLAQMEAKADHYQNALESSRAVVAELNVTVGHEQLARKYAESLIKELRTELEDEQNARLAESMERAEDCRRACEQGCEASPLSMGITFPYATRQLEAMRDAALAHWMHHDRSKPAPYGIQKTVASFLADRTGQNSRKIMELAMAIKPDDLPKF